MTDCPNVEIRELLPEYLAGALEGSRKTLVETHLTSCADCRAELETIRLVREVFTSVSAPVDVASIVAALPGPRPRSVSRPPMRSWARSHAFQIAAAISFVALGGVSLSVTRSFFAVDEQRTQGAAEDSTSEWPMGMPAISFAGGVSDLDDGEIQTLIAAIESMDALPVAEPDAVILSVAEGQGSQEP